MGVCLEPGWGAGEAAWVGVTGAPSPPAGPGSPRELVQAPQRSCCRERGRLLTRGRDLAHLLTLRRPMSASGWRAFPHKLQSRDALPPISPELNPGNLRSQRWPGSPGLCCRCPHAGRAGPDLTGPLGAVCRGSRQKGPGGSWPQEF